MCFCIFITGVKVLEERRADLYAKALNRKHKSLNNPSNTKSLASEEEQFLTNSPYVRSTTGPDGFKLICYYALPVNASENDVLLPADLNASLCTHINLAFASVSNDSLIPANAYDVEVCKRISYSLVSSTRI